MSRDEVVELSARLAVIEFYLEVIFAQAYSLRTQRAQTDALNSIHNIVAKDAALKTKNEDFDVEFLGDVHSEMVKYSKLMQAKIDARSNSIRAEREQEKTNH